MQLQERWREDGGVGGGVEEGPGAVNVAPTGESNTPSCFKRWSTAAAQGSGAEQVDGAD